MIRYSNPSLKLEKARQSSGKVAWRSPSNIALVKYWGKYGLQLPRNPSVSLTLSASYTETSLAFLPRQQAPKARFDKKISLEFYFEDQPAPAFEAKIEKYLESLLPIFPFLAELHLEIFSHNSFPHSAGIASSASSMAALALCLCSMEELLFGTTLTEGDFYQKASFLARLGSGSAARSIHGRAVVWGKTSKQWETSEEWGVPFEALHPIFEDYQDTILLIHEGEKSVSSRAGHALMNQNPFSAIRYEQAHQHAVLMLNALQSGDLEKFIEITEKEAFVLHALMMVSEPSFILMKPNTLRAIEVIQFFRQQTQVPICFTLDAGPNVHILYPKSYQERVLPFIKSELAPLAHHSQYILDQVGQGSVALT
jgi:diphosphomevalonate decarboxylase